MVSSQLDPIELQQFQFNPDSQFSSTGYTICNELTKHCHDIGYLPFSKTFVMTDNSFCQLIEDTEEFISDVALSLDVSNNQAVSAVSNFFKDRSILVSQSGVPGYVYKIGTYAQTAGRWTSVICKNGGSFRTPNNSNATTLVNCAPNSWCDVFPLLEITQLVEHAIQLVTH